VAGTGVLESVLMGSLVMASAMAALLLNND
jgi:hypothetical protein